MLDKENMKENIIDLYKKVRKKNVTLRNLILFSLTLYIYFGIPLTLMLLDLTWIFIGIFVYWLMIGLFPFFLISSFLILQIPYALFIWNGIDVFFRIKQYEKDMNRRGLGEALVAKGILYHIIKKYPRALNNFQKAFDLFNEIKYEEGIMIVYCTCAALHEDMQDFEKAKIQFEKCLELAKARNEWKFARDVTLILASINEKEGLFEIAEKYNFMADEIKERYL